MKVSKQARIIGLGSYVPEQILSNTDLEKMVETSDEWIVSRTGMKERRLAAKDQYTSDIGYEAVKKAMHSANISAESIDLILFVTITPDYIFPGTACLIQKKLNASNAAVLDIQAACTGYLHALATAKAYVESGMYKTILMVSADKLSSIVDYSDRNTCVLFGDGASACVIAGEGKGYAINKIILGADGDQSQLLILPAGGSKKPATHETVKEGEHYLQMAGKEVYKHAVRRMEMSVKNCLDVAGLKEEDISWLVPHQANIRIIESIAKRFKIPKERVFLTIHKYGNTSASSVGIALEELIKQNDVQSKEHIMLTAFGAGLTYGAALLTCEVD